MIPDLLHIPLAALACYFLWQLWRSLADKGWTSLLVATGLVVRAMGGQVLYWISYLGLPIARPLQLGEGFWFFAVDGPGMLANTRMVLSQGPMAVLVADNRIPSRTFIQVYAVFAWLFGTFGSVAILLNCAAYLATCVLILRIGPRDPRTELAKVVAIAAMALGPGTILWSLQLLKDTLFLFLIAAMIALCDYWQGVWRATTPLNWRAAGACAVTLVLVVFAISGMRWYIAFFLWIIWPVFALLTTILSRRKIAAALAHLLLFVVIGRAVRIGGGTDLPGSVRLLLDPRPTVAAAVRPAVFETDLAGTRSGFESTPGATTIVAGRTLARVRIGEQQPAIKTAFTKPAVTPRPETLVSEKKSGDPTMSTRPAVEPRPETLVVERKSGAPTMNTQPGVEPRPEPLVVEKKSGAPTMNTQHAVEPRPETRLKLRGVQVQKTAPLVPESKRSEALPVVPRSKGNSSTRRSDVLTTTVAGLVATFLPRTLAQLFGLVQIGGGRGFWLFVELDTFVFDALLLFAIVSCARGLRARSRPTPLFFLLLLVFLATAIPLAYTVNNFGTLFRMRQMLYVMLAFLPLTLVPRAREHAPEE